MDFRGARGGDQVRVRAPARRGARAPGLAAGRRGGARSTSTTAAGTTSEPAGRAHLRALLSTLTNRRPSGTTAAAAALRRAIDLLEPRPARVHLRSLRRRGSGRAELRRAVAHRPRGRGLPRADRRTSLDWRSAAIRARRYRDRPHGADQRRGRRRAYRQDARSSWSAGATRCAASGIDYTLARTDTPLDATLRGYLLQRRARERADDRLAEPGGVRRLAGCSPVPCSFTCCCAGARPGAISNAPLRRAGVRRGGAPAPAVRPRAAPAARRDRRRGAPLALRAALLADGRTVAQLGVAPDRARSWSTPARASRRELSEEAAAEVVGAALPGHARFDGRPTGPALAADALALAIPDRAAARSSSSRISSAERSRRGT